MSGMPRGSLWLLSLNYGLHEPKRKVATGRPMALFWHEQDEQPEVLLVKCLVSQGVVLETVEMTLETVKTEVLEDLNEEEARKSKFPKRPGRMLTAAIV